MLDIYHIPAEEIKKIEWAGDPVAYDYEIFKLGAGHDTFIAVNPDVSVLANVINSIPDVGVNRCIVWSFRGQWIAKYFTKCWADGKRYKEVDIELSQEEIFSLASVNSSNITASIEWIRNPDINEFMSFKDNPYKLSIDDLSNLNYEMVWYLDPKFNPLDVKVWVYKCRLKNYPTVGTKDMGYVTPKIKIVQNPEIPKIDFDLEYSIPWYDLNYEHVWYLDPRFNPTEDKIWAVKLKLINGIPKPTKEMGYVSPKIIFNPDLEEVAEYIIDEHIPYYDLKYEHVWMLDDMLTDSLDEVWAAKIVPHDPQGTTVVGNIKVKLPTGVEYIPMKKL